MQRLAGSKIPRVLFNGRRGYANHIAASHLKEENAAAKVLVSLSLAPNVSSKDAIDKEAIRWIDSLKQTRKEMISEDSRYRPNQVFSREGAKEIDLFQQAVDEKSSEKFQPSWEQNEEYQRIKGVKIVEKKDATISYLTNMIMKDGKKASAEQTLSRALYLVHLKRRSDPVQLLKNALEQMGPLVKLKRYTDGGARAELVPVPLSERQRLRQAWLWILEAANKRPSKEFSVRLAEEILAAANGKSPGFEKKTQQHKLAISNRAFIKLLTRKR